MTAKNKILLCLLIVAVALIFSIALENRQWYVEELAKEREKSKKHLRKADSISKAHEKTLIEFESLIVIYRHTKDAKEKAERQALESEQKRINEKRKPVIRYTDKQLDSLRAVHFGHH